MKRQPIMFEWTRKGKNYSKEVDRQNFFDVMESIQKAFVGQNRVSTTFCTIIPNVEKIYINFDRNSELDVPFVLTCLPDNESGVISIKRHHKIIWEILKKYCED